MILAHKAAAMLNRVVAKIDFYIIYSIVWIASGEPWSLRQSIYVTLNQLYEADFLK